MATGRRYSRVWLLPMTLWAIADIPSGVVARDPGSDYGSPNVICPFHACDSPDPPCRCDGLCHYYGDCCFDAPGPNVTLMSALPPNRLLQCREVPGKRGTLWMIGDCPEAEPIGVRESCVLEPSRQVNEVGSIRPVWDVQGNMYKNYHCATCNGVERVDIVYWGIAQTCSDCPESLTLGQHNTVNLSSDACHNAYQDEPDLARLRSCDERPVSTCPDGADSRDTQMCATFQSPGFYGGIYHKNEFCAKCNGMNESAQWQSQCEFLIDSYDPGQGERLLVSIFSFVLPCFTDCEPYVPPVPSCYSGEASTRDWIILSIDSDQYEKCENLADRAEDCFYASLEKEIERNISLPWDRVKEGWLWNGRWVDMNVRAFYLPEYEQSLRHDLDTAIIKITKEKACYLREVELVRTCSKELDNLDLCVNGTVVYFRDQNGTVEESLANVAGRYQRTYVVSWFATHTRIVPLGESPLTELLTVCLVPIETEGEFDNLREQTYHWLHRIIGGICAGLAIVCHIATFLTYLIHKPLRNTFGVVLMSFVTALAVGILLVQFINDIVTSAPGVTCQVFAVVGHYSWLSVFVWMTVLAYDLRATLATTKLRVRKASSTKRLLCYCLLGWGLPLLTIAGSVTLWLCDCTRIPIMYGSDMGGSCWIHDSHVALVMVGIPLVVCLLTSSVLFTSIGKSLYHHRANSATARRESQGASRRGKKTELLVYIKIFMLMGFAWFCGFLAAFTRIQILWLFYYLSFLLQGLLIFIFFGLTGRAGKLWRSKVETLTSTIVETTTV